MVRDGDLVKLDFGVVVDGLFADSAITVPVGAVNAEAQRLTKRLRTCLSSASAVRTSDRLSIRRDVGFRVDDFERDAGICQRARQ